MEHPIPPPTYPPPTPPLMGGSFWGGGATAIKFFKYTKIFIKKIEIRKRLL